MFSKTRFEARPYGYVDARRMLSVMRLTRQEELGYTISEVIDTDTGQPVTEADLEALVAAGKGDC